MLPTDLQNALTPNFVNSLSLDRKVQLRNLLRRRKIAEQSEKLYQLFPDQGPHRRELYPKHLEHFAAGAIHRERCLMAANRIGKTVAGAYEVALHLTGRYPDWWAGKRFEEATDCWAAGDTSETTRDIVQLALTGVSGEAGESALGTGLIPGSDIVGEPTHRRGIAGAYDTITVTHQSGGESKLGFKSYDQGRKKFQGTAKHVIWLDEEPPIDVYSECLMRTMTTAGQIICTFTPLSGMTEVALQFLQGDER